MKRYRFFQGKLREHSAGDWVRYADTERLQNALHEVAEMIEHETDRMRNTDNEFTGRVVSWHATDERCDTGETIVHIIVQDEDIRNGRVPIGRFIQAARTKEGES